MADPIRRLTVSILGTTVLDILLGTAPEPQQASSGQPDGEVAGPVTDRRAAPALGFSTRPRDVHGRPDVR